MNKLLTMMVWAPLLLSGCNGMIFGAPSPTATATAMPPTATASATLIPTRMPTFTPSPIPTPTWVTQGPDAVQVPILIYHHIEVSPIDSRYYVRPDRFEDQIKLLRDWEYTSISTELLVKAITQGAKLPPRPVIITFDDGHLDNYTTAFPIMQKYSFTGVLYIVGKYLGTPGYMNSDQIIEMYHAGWEVGSHSMSHPDTTILEPEQQRYEIVESRKFLQDILGLPILTFAYPFGAEDRAATDYAHFAGYIAAMGATGFTSDQGSSNLYVLQRMEVKGQDDVKTFLRFLPWHGDPIYLPTDTPTPTARPSRTPIPTYTQYPTRTPKPTETLIPTSIYTP
jgi:peptidoglycan/xylan/chitin deacetylase (PgdA/CDA1 family)